MIAEWKTQNSWICTKYIRQHYLQRLLGTFYCVLNTICCVEARLNALVAYRKNVVAIKGLSTNNLSCSATFQFIFGNGSGRVVLILLSLWQKLENWFYVEKDLPVIAPNHKRHCLSELKLKPIFKVNYCHKELHFRWNSVPGPVFCDWKDLRGFCAMICITLLLKKWLKIKYQISIQFVYTNFNCTKVDF